MRKNKLLTCIVVICLVWFSADPSLAAENTNKISDYLIAENSVGPAKLGMKFGELKSSLPEDYIVQSDSGGVDVAGCKVLNSSDNKELFFIVTKLGTCKDNDIIKAIQVSSYLFKTKEGLGAGSLVSDAEKIYGKATLSFNQEAESREYVKFENFHSHILFRDYEHYGIYDKKPCSYCQTSKYKDDARIDAIELYSIN